MTRRSLTLRLPSGFSLTASHRFLMGFAGGRGGSDTSTVDLAFALDSTWQQVGTRGYEHHDSIVVDVVANPDGASDEAIRQNLVRILNLHVDGDPFMSVGARDQVVEHLRQQHAGLRPVQFPTPWEAAAWAVIGHRIRMTHAAAIMQRLSAQFGHRIEFPGGRAIDGFPGPDVVLSLPTMPGLTARKFGTLQGIARAAMEGALDADRLLNLPHAEACADLQTLYGIGPFSAELILVRGAGVTDLFPTNDPRLTKAMVALYGTTDPTEHMRIAEQWRPFRSWVALLIRHWLEAETGEIARGIPAATIPTPGLARHPL